MTQIPLNYSSSAALSVEQLLGQFKNLAEMSFPDVWVQGEVSQVSSPKSGHVYFTLKGDSSLLRCVLFKNKRYQARCLPTAGTVLLIRGKVSVYTQRCELQLIVSYLEDAGEGVRRREFELLKARLQAAGYFESSHKQPLPMYPAHIAIVTSASGAALQDALSTLDKRFPIAKVTLLPTTVQGETAAAEMTAALRQADTDLAAEVILLIRGGGSNEDLNSFNDAGLAEQIFNCRTPIISGVGHETDFTIADFVADKRALTPTDAAVLATPDKFALHKTIAGLRDNLEKAMLTSLANRQQQKDYLLVQLPSPQSQVQRQKVTISVLRRRLDHLIAAKIARAQFLVQASNSDLERQAPLKQIARLAQRKTALSHRLERLWQQQNSYRRHLLLAEKSKLGALNPLSTLSRGYAIMSRDDGTIISDASKIKRGEIVHNRLHKGTVSSKIL